MSNTIIEEKVETKINTNGLLILLIEINRLILIIAHDRFELTFSQYHLIASKFRAAKCGQLAMIRNYSYNIKLSIEKLKIENIIQLFF